MSNNQYKKPVRIQPLQVLKFLKDVFSALSSSPQRHPELFVTGLQGLKKVYIINHPGLAQHILQKNYTNYVKGDGYKVVARLLGKGLVTNDGENWHKQRTLIQPAFHRGTLKKISEIVTSSTNAVLDSWKNKEGQSINFTQEMAGLTIDIVAKSLFTTDVTHRQIQTIWHNVNYLNESSDKILRNPLPMPWFVPTPEHLKMRKAIAELDDLMYGIINRRKTEKNPPLDLLQMLLEARYENSDQGMSDQQIRDEVMTIFLAGHETTVNALSWTWYLVKQHAGVEKLLREESETLALNRDPVFEELPGMPYGRNVMNESMRLYPPVPAVGRRAKSEDVAGGYRLEKGADIAINILGIHRHPAFWSEASAFKPERFENFDMKGDNRFVFMPFGGGPRICIGNNFAMMEMQLINAMLSARVEMELESRDIKPKALVTLKPADGIIMKLKKIKTKQSSTKEMLVA